MKFKFVCFLHKDTVQINSRSSALLSESSPNGSIVVMEILVNMQT